MMGILGKRANPSGLQVVEDIAEQAEENKRLVVARHHCLAALPGWGRRGKRGRGWCRRAGGGRV